MVLLIYGTKPQKCIILESWNNADNFGDFQYPVIHIIKQYCGATN